mmetsp:Transcript_24513/g.72636  ORF Transcript_24513/g.72636 Transcript_24513/m.72636 type:complete len:403 (+) Transcript_24513:1014-2222(+)
MHRLGQRGQVDEDLVAEGECVWVLGRGQRRRDLGAAALAALAVLAAALALALLCLCLWLRLRLLIKLAADLDAVGLGVAAAHLLHLGATRVVKHKHKVWLRPLGLAVAVVFLALHLRLLPYAPPHVDPQLGWLRHGGCGAVLARCLCQRRRTAHAGQLSERPVVSGARERRDLRRVDAAGGLNRAARVEVDALGRLDAHDRGLEVGHERTVRVGIVCRPVLVHRPAGLVEVHKRRQHRLLAISEAVLRAVGVWLRDVRLEVGLLVVGQLSMLALALVGHDQLQQRGAAEIVGAARLVWSRHHERNHLGRGVEFLGQHMNDVIARQVLRALQPAVFVAVADERKFERRGLVGVHRVKDVALAVKDDRRKVDVHVLILWAFAVQSKAELVAPKWKLQVRHCDLF